MNLQHYQDFKQALDHYHMSERAHNALRDLRLVLIVGPTSSGRNTIIRYLVETGDYHYIISDTTRPPRVNDGVLEKSGREYWFRSEEEVLADLKAGEFLEAELIHDQQVSGISIREVERAKRDRKIAITDIDLQGVHNVIKAKPDTTVIMLLPPSFEEWQHRLTKRGRMSGVEYSRRLETAKRIFADGLEHNFYNFVIAENVEQSAALTDAIVKGQANPHQDRGRTVIMNIQDQLHQKLASPGV